MNKFQNRRIISFDFFGLDKISNKCSCDVDIDKWYPVAKTVGTFSWSLEVLVGHRGVCVLTKPYNQSFACETEFIQNCLVVISNAHMGGVTKIRPTLH